MSRIVISRIARRSCGACISASWCTCCSAPWSGSCSACMSRRSRRSSVWRSRSSSAGCPSSCRSWRPTASLRRGRSRTRCGAGGAPRSCTSRVPTPSPATTSGRSRSPSARAARGAAVSTTPAAQSAAPAAGDLLDVVALDRTGTLVRSDGTLVRYYELIPQNPEVLAEDQQEVMIDGFGRALGALRAGETLQIYAVAAPIQLPELLTQLQQRLTDCLDSQPADRASAYRELAAAYEQTLRRRTI